MTTFRKIRAMARELNMATMINSPFKWVGGKSRLRKYIISILPSHTCYVEPFGGAAWVLFGKERSDVEVLNDIDQELINFFRVVKTQPEEFIHTFDLALVSRAEFERLAELDLASATSLERAHRFYYLIMAGWGGELDYPRFQTSIQDGGHGNRLIGALKGLRQRIEPVHERLKTVIIECLPWEGLIERYDRDGTVFYLDPPYPGNGCNYYHNMRDRREHELLAGRLRKAKAKWILSSYDAPEVHEMYDDYYITPIRAFSGMQTKKKRGSTRVENVEVLITNYDPEKYSTLPLAVGQQLSFE